MYRLQRIWRPGIFQGGNRKDNYFEGWYFKLVGSRLKNIFAVIPGVSIKGSSGSHAFIQLLDGKQAVSSYFNFSINDFSYSKDRFDVSIGKNRFSPEKMLLDINQEGKTVKADIGFKNRKEWPGSFFSPGAMGWYSFVPFMECYHGVVSMDHDLEGSLEMDGRSIDLNGGKGYIEKDWGISFPRGWIWLQANNFDKNNPCSIMLSIARIPWRGRSFTGFICGLLCVGDFQVLATYNGARIENMEYSSNHDGVKVSIILKDLRLEVEANKKQGAQLASPVLGAMDGRINESIDSLINVTLLKKDKVIFDDTGRCGGFEIVNPEVLDK
jgi:hypothetical protein